MSTNAPDTMSPMNTPSGGSQGVSRFEDVIRKELDRTLDPSLQPFLDARDGAANLLRELPKVYGPASVMAPGSEQRAWELVALHLRDQRRPHEGIAILAALYRQMLTGQLAVKKRVHKGMPLVWMSDMYAQLGFPALAKRYLMLTLCEDAVASRGTVSPESSGVYFRLSWFSVKMSPASDRRREIPPYGRGFLRHRDLSDPMAIYWAA